MAYFFRCCIFSFFCCSIYNICVAQKPALDSSIFDNWPNVVDPYISNDGNYFLYTVNNETRGSFVGVVRGIHNIREWRFQGISSRNIKFTDNSKRVFFLMGKDSLCQLNLDNNRIVYVPEVTEFRLFMHVKTEYLLYLEKDGALGRTLIIRRLDNGIEQRFNGIKGYSLSSNGSIVSLEREISVNGKESSELTIVNVPSSTHQIIYEGEKIIGDVIFDKLSVQLAFVSISQKVDDKITRTVWNYKLGDQRAYKITSDESGSMNEMHLGRLLHFGKKRNYIYCWIREKKIPLVSDGAVKVNVWHYKDSKLQTQQLQSLDPNYFIGIVNLSNGEVKLVNNVNESVVLDEDGLAEEERLLVTYRKGDVRESYWNHDSKENSYIIYGDNMKRKSLMNNSRWILLPPAGRYVYEYDSIMKDLYSYEIYTGEVRNLTKNMPIPIVDSSQDMPLMKHFRGLLITGWLSNDAGVLLYDGFDIWNVDPKAERAAICLTNGYGRTHNISFNFAVNQEKKLLSGHERMILKAFDNNTKKSGFYSMKLDRSSDPKFLSMDTCRYEFIQGTEIISRAKNKAIYIVSRGSTKNSPNFYWTKNFKTFTSLTTIYPEKNWNWLSGELVNWTGSAGEALQGILYKPENFDPNKKYPIIFNYYEILSENLYKYQRPEATRGLLNIPWFVSQEYLVFTPDIHFKVGHPGESSFKTVESAARYLSKFPWVDSAHMGLQGHSWSGYQTAYMVTNSNLFAAAVEAAGPTDFINTSGSIMQEGIGSRFFTEDQQFRIGVTLWDRSELYIENSPIFSVDKVITPLLIMHSKTDNVIPFDQGLEFFTAFRRLGKRVWMLQYDNGDHGLTGSDAIDFTFRMTQFYDYYLKQSLPPRWMTRVIPAKLKGVDHGLELDSSILIP